MLELYSIMILQIKERVSAIIQEIDSATVALLLVINHIQIQKLLNWWLFLKIMFMPGFSIWHGQTSTHHCSTDPN